MGYLFSGMLNVWFEQILNSFSCKESTIQSRQDVGSLSDRIAVSVEFNNTLIWTKRFYRSTIMEMLYASTDDKKNKILANRLISQQKTTFTQEEIAALFKYPNFEVFKVNYQKYFASFQSLFSKFPELLKLDPESFDNTLAQSISKFTTNFVNLKKKSLTDGRTETCATSFGSCMDLIITRVYQMGAVCSVGSIGGTVLGAIITGPVGPVIGLAVGVGCMSAVGYWQGKQQDKCSAAFSTCTTDFEITSDITSFYDVTFWQAVSSPLQPMYYQDPEGHIYWY